MVFLFFMDFIAWIIWSYGFGTTHFKQSILVSGDYSVEAYFLSDIICTGISQRLSRHQSSVFSLSFPYLSISYPSSSLGGVGFSQVNQTRSISLQNRKSAHPFREWAEWSAPLPLMPLFGGLCFPRHTLFSLSHIFKWQNLCVKQSRLTLLSIRGIVWELTRFRYPAVQTANKTGPIYFCFDGCLQCFSHTGKRPEGHSANTAA